MNVLSSLSGFIVGFGSVVVVWYFSVRKGKKENRFDERYQTIHSKARSISYQVTILALVLLWIFVMLYEGPKLAFFALTALYVIAMLSYIVTAYIFNQKH